MLKGMTVVDEVVALLDHSIILILSWRDIRRNEALLIIERRDALERMHRFLHQGSVSLLPSMKSIPYTNRSPCPRKSLTGFQ